MSIQFSAPGRYLQGPGLLSRLAEHTAPLGDRALVLISPGGYRRMGASVEASFAKRGTAAVMDQFQGEPSLSQIHRLQRKMEEHRCNLVIGIGGGKILDAAKAAAHLARLPVAVCPTAASTDAPCTALSVLYTDEGLLDRYLPLSSNPQLVVMDTAVIAASPVRLTVSGMGDALSTWFEARAAARTKPVSAAALALAHRCWQVLQADGAAAKGDLERGVLSPAVERIVEANTLLSGIGFESGGLAAAHAIHNGLITLEECRSRCSHGEIVAFSTIVQLFLEGGPAAEREEVFSFLAQVGLPRSLEQLGISPCGESGLRQAAEEACAAGSPIHNMPFPVTPQAVYQALLAADGEGRRYS